MQNDRVKLILFKRILPLALIAKRRLVNLLKKGGGVSLRTVVYKNAFIGIEMINEVTADIEVVKYRPSQTLLFEKPPPVIRALGQSYARLIVLENLAATSQNDQPAKGGGQQS